MRVEVVPVPPIIIGTVALVVTVGVINVGELLKTARPVPVSSDKTPASWAEVVAANCERGFATSASPVPVVGVVQVRIPDPSVVKTWLALPSVVGNVSA